MRRSLVCGGTCTGGTRREGGTVSLRTFQGEGDGVQPAAGSAISRMHYLNAGGWDNLGGPVILDLALKTPEVEWTVFGMKADEIPGELALPSNIRFLVWVTDPLAVLAQNHLFVQLVEHYAYSGTVREAQAIDVRCFTRCRLRGRWWSGTKTPNKSPGSSASWRRDATLVSNQGIVCQLCTPDQFFQRGASGTRNRLADAATLPLQADVAELWQCRFHLATASMIRSWSSGSR